jgi:hypothetical protein
MPQTSIFCIKSIGNVRFAFVLPGFARYYEFRCKRSNQANIHAIAPCRLGSSILKQASKTPNPGFYVLLKPNVM